MSNCWRTQKEVRKKCSLLLSRWWFAKFHTRSFHTRTSIYFDKVYWRKFFFAYIDKIFARLHTKTLANALTGCSRFNKSMKSNFTHEVRPFPYEINTNCFHPNRDLSWYWRITLYGVNRSLDTRRPSGSDVLETDSGRLLSNIEEKWRGVCRFYFKILLTLDCSFGPIYVWI